MQMELAEIQHGPIELRRTLTATLEPPAELAVEPKSQAPDGAGRGGGLSVSALITLGLIPVVYSLTHRER